MSGKYILVTGGSGFLGQHLLREIHGRPNFLDAKGIIVADRKPFKQVLDYTPTLPVIEHLVDLASLPLTRAMFQQYDIAAVFHLASSRIPVALMDLTKDAHRDTVVTTKNILQCMKEHSVTLLVHVADALQVCGSLDTQAPTELGSADPPGWALFGQYAQAKYAAERMVLDSDGRPVDNGDLMRASVIRPTPMYGEGDTQLMPYVLRMCEQYGHLPRTSQDTGITSFTYAGNVADMMLRLAEKMVQDAKVFGGEVFFATEHTYAEQAIAFYEPLVGAVGYKPAEKPVIFELFLPLLILLSLLLRLLSSLLPLDVLLPSLALWPTPAVLRIASCWWVHFKAIKARTLLDYLPKYEPVEAQAATAKWLAGNYHKK